MSKKTNIKINLGESDTTNIKTLKNFIPSELVKTDIAVAVAGSIDAGKCLIKGTKIMLYSGKLANVEDIKVGDLVMGDDSTPRKVLETHKGTGQLYKIIPKNGLEYTVNGNHILCLKYSSVDNIVYQKNKKRYIIKYAQRYNDNIDIKYKFIKVNNGKSQKDAYKEAVKFMDSLKYNKLNHGDLVEMSVKDFIKIKKINQNILKWYRVGVEFKEQTLPLDPYIIGYWLGDHDSNSSVITIEEKFIAYYRTYLKYVGMQFKQSNITKHHKITTGYQNNDSWTRYKDNYKVNKFTQTLKQLNLLNNKHIPDIYKFNSRQNRLKLLAGLIDSNGYYNKERNTYQFTISNKNETLIDHIIYLIRSLGFSTYKYCKKSIGRNQKNCYAETNIYRFEFGGVGQEQIPSLLERNMAKPSETKKSNMVMSIKIVNDIIGDYYGFGTDGNHRFLLGDFSVTHNSSLIGVLFSGQLDDGNGSARNIVARHKHEVDTGRTSDITTRMLYCGNGKAITMIDLCGHEKYLKTTTSGITGQFPDYAVVIVAANRGILTMS